MYSVEKGKLGKAVPLLKASHMENPRIAIELEDVAEKAEFLEIQANCELEELYGRAEIWMLEGEKGLLVAFHNKRLTFLQYLKVARLAANAVNKIAGKENLKLFSRNEKKLRKITDPGWAEKLGKGAGYYRIFDLYIPPKHRRKGLGSKMLAPLLEFCDEGKLPIAVEVYSKESVYFFESLGFEAIRVRSDESLELACSEMVRAPQDVQDNSSKNGNSPVEEE